MFDCTSKIGLFFRSHFRPRAGQKGKGTVFIRKERNDYRRMKGAFTEVEEESFCSGISGMSSTNVLQSKVCSRVKESAFAQRQDFFSNQDVVEASRGEFFVWLYIEERQEL